jgi:phage repressor protein C with HTH and peptisase S24 domain
MKKGSPDKMSLIKVKGDSMEPTLLSGDMILVDHSKNFIDPQGGIYAIVMEDMIMIKRLQVLGQGRIRVVSDNLHYEPIEMNADALIINGKVLWFCRDMER